MGGYQILELGMTGLKQLQFFFAGLDLGLKSPYIRIVRIILIKLRYLRKGESELFELDYLEKFLQLFRAVITVSRPHIHYAGFKQPYFLIMSQCPDRNSSESGKLADFIPCLCHH